MNRLINKKENGLRNARLEFRQTEENHIMENIIYNELRIRGFRVDVGLVEHYGKDDNGIVTMGICNFLLDENSLDL